MKSLALIILVLMSLACTVRDDNSAIAGQSLITYADRSLADWDTDKAIPEAEADIKAGTAKLYLSGTIAMYAPGISAEEYHRFRELPIADAGIGCLIIDAPLRTAQLEYAKVYNRYIADNYVSK